VPTAPMGQKRVLTRRVLLEKMMERYRAEGQLEHLRYVGTAVPGYGSTDPKYMLIGDTPTAEDVRMKIPFTGRPGMLLKELLTSIDLNRELIWSTNVVKYRTIADRDPSKLELDASVPYLWEEIDLVRPKYLVLLGRYVTEQFFEGHSFQSLVGGWQKWSGYDVFPTYSLKAATLNLMTRPHLFTHFHKLGEVE